MIYKLHQVTHNVTALLGVPPWLDTYSCILLLGDSVYVCYETLKALNVHVHPFPVAASPHLYSVFSRRE